MANYHFEVKVVSRRKGNSVSGQVNYITGQRLRDPYYGKTYYRSRDDVACWRIMQLPGAPPDFFDLQGLCDNMEEAENRCDARTARQFTASLPNELPLSEQISIIEDFIWDNLMQHDLCAIYAIHEGKNKDDPTRDNPHVHIIVPTRTVGTKGFNKKKDREHDKRKYIGIWRERWASLQNRAYERNRLDIRVSHESFEVQGKWDREPTIHVSRIDWQREMRGERTAAGDEKRAIKERNRDRERQRQVEHEQGLERSR